MTVNVLADRHQAGLWHSLQLMTRRFGWTLYTPKGMDWWQAQYWQFGAFTYPDARLAEQYLVGAAVSPDEEYPDDPIAFVTLEEAKAMPWAYVVATLQDNQQGFDRFAREVGAKLVFQVGNTGQQIDWGRDPLVLSSSEMPLLGKGIVYHQEFDSAGLFRFREPTGTKEIRCFVHLLPEMADPRCWPAWLAMGQALPEYTFKRYGHAPRLEDPTWVENAKPISRIADLMARSEWGWHDKAQGDGFGHVLHGWAAIGRPLIGHASHYKGKMAEVFWTPETSIDLDKVSIEEAAEIVRRMSPEEHAIRCRMIRRIFDREIDWDREAAEIAAFLGVREEVTA